MTHHTLALPRGFSLIELLVVIGIIALVSSFGFVALRQAQVKARDTKRVYDLGQIGRYLTRGSCYIPAAGAGDYDMADLAQELKAQYPQLASVRLPVDPKAGTEEMSGYRYAVADAERCAVYGNLENEAEPVTLPQLSAPTPGAGSGVLEAETAGVNQTRMFYQAGS